MALNGVPWAIDNGAEIYASLMRTITYSVYGGQEGVLEKDHFAVSEYDTPGPGVQFTRGVANILSRAPGGFCQSYVVRNPGPDGTLTTLDIDPTDSSGARSDLVILRVEDPEDGSGLWAPPTDKANGPYVRPFVIQGVPSTTKSMADLPSIGPWTALALARIDRPASTATITNDMITDLRIVNNPATGLGPAPNGPGAEKLWTEESHTTTEQHFTATTYTNFPAEANWTVNIPEWATAVDIYALIMNAKIINGDVWGDAMVAINGVLGGYSTGFDLNLNGNKDPYRAPIFISGTQPIPADARGTAANVKIMLQMRTSQPGTIVADIGTYTHIQLNFKQTPVYV